jgi:large subunit ribosomal protein L20
MRVKRGTVSRRKHNKLLASTKGYRMTKNRLIRVAHEAALHAGQYAFAGRKLKKRDMRSLWITRISHAIRPFGLSYSRFIGAMHKAHIDIDRKMMSILLNQDPDAFKAIVDKAKTAQV